MIQQNISFMQKIYRNPNFSESLKFLIFWGGHESLTVFLNFLISCFRQNQGAAASPFPQGLFFRPKSVFFLKTRVPPMFWQVLD